MSNNESLMESILTQIRKLILLTEPGEEEKLEKLVNMACEVSNQIVRIENGECNNVGSDDSDDESDNEETCEIEEE